MQPIKPYLKEYGIHTVWNISLGRMGIYVFSSTDQKCWMKIIYKWETVLRLTSNADGMGGSMEQTNQEYGMII